MSNAPDGPQHDGRDDRNDYNGDGRFRRRRRRGRRRNYDNNGEQSSGGGGGAPTITSVNLEVPEDKTIIIGITGEPGAGKAPSLANSPSWGPPSSTSTPPVTR